MDNKILIYDTAVSDMLSGKTFGGIAVQLFFWAQVFRENDWEVHMLTYEPSDYNKDGIIYHSINNTQRLNLVFEFTDSQRLCRRIRPNLVMLRGAQRKVYALTSAAHSVGAKIVMFGASDVNFDLERANVGNRVNRWLYGRGLHKVDYFVCQNSLQHDTLLRNFGRDSIVMFNIWGHYKDVVDDSEISEGYDAVWIANFRALKRPDWMLNLARKFPDRRFAMAGAGFDSLYNIIERQAATIPNLDFFGPVSLSVSTRLAQTAKVLLCTSEYEGFPNTFLQAWSAGVPVISTIDPSGIITNNHLGVVVDTEEALAQTFSSLMNKPEDRSYIQNSINHFFSQNMDPMVAYNRLRNLYCS